jgi:PiT family inorganic phosphate transporter
MGLIMLILIGTVPTTYALNRALPDSQIAVFEQTSMAAATVVNAKAAGYNVMGNPRPAVTLYVAQHQINEGTYPSLAALITDISNQVKQYGSLLYNGQAGPPLPLGAGICPTALLITDL